MQHLVKILVAVTALSISSLSSAYIIDGGTYDGTNVGGLDTLVGTTTTLPGPGSSEASEMAWLNTLINPDVADPVKTEGVQTFKTDDLDVIAFDLSDAPEYFIIKNANDAWAAFKNNNNFDWGVISLAALGDLATDMNFIKVKKDGSIQINYLELSHVTEFGESDESCQSDCDPREVPEPATLGLLAIGLLGLGAARRRSI